MKLKPELKGYAYILLATVAGSTVYVFSKAALNEVSLGQFGVYWFAMAIVWNTLWTMRSAEHRKFHEITRKSFRVLVLLGLIEMVATGTFYGAISVASNPAIPAFLRNTEYIFVTLLGVILLSERFKGLEIAAVMLTFTGAFVISYHKGGSLSSYLTGSSGLMMICTSFYAIRTILAKTFIKTITPTMLAINRAIFLLLLASVLLVVNGQSLKIPTNALINILIGSFMGPFLTSIGQYSALKYIEASRAAIIQSTTSLFVVLGVFLYFGKLPLAYQIAGGLLTVGGVVVLIMGRRVSSRPSVRG
ncbi:MAG: DMT family transporter [Bacteroidia bacterium]|nr:DMT family transporter [Bacteroidia bacterium]